MKVNSAKYCRVVREEERWIRTIGAISEGLSAFSGEWKEQS